MHTVLPLLLAMVAAIVLLQLLANKLRVAYPILLVVAGLLVGFIPGLPRVQVEPELIFFGFLLGGIVSPPDAVSTGAITRFVRIPKSTSAILEGESLLNDASSLIIFR